jgi:hypothetical protein
MDFPEQGADDLISAVFMSNFGDDTAGIWRSWVILLATIVALLSLLTFFSGTLRGNG